MSARRGTDVVRDLARGPGRPCEALAISRELDGCDLTRRGPLWVAQAAGITVDQAQIRTATRIGVTSAADLPLRYFIADNRYVSKLTRNSRRPPGP